MTICEKCGVELIFGDTSVVVVEDMIRMVICGLCAMKE